VLRITRGTENGADTLTLEGKLSGPWVDELERCWSDLRRNRCSLVRVILQDVSFCDARGKDLLLSMERAGVSLVQCSGFIRQLLGARNRVQKQTQNAATEEN
jgi:hypothetical protein